jgi:hypothetical protein
MRALLFPLLLFVSATASTQAGRPDGLILSGLDYAYIVIAPEGWSAVRASFADTVFFPSTHTYETSPVLMYVRSAHKVTLKVRTVAELNALDLRGMQERSPRIESRKAGELAIRDGTKIPVYSFTGGKFLESVAYADHPKTITVFVLSAETAETLQSTAEALRALVLSYQWVSDAVTAR